MTTEEETNNSTCIHPVIYDGICSECGAFVTPDSRYHKSQDIYVLSSTIGTSKLEPFLLERKKLALVVDLDKTLIDTIAVQNQEEAEKIIALDKEHESDYFFVKVNEMYLVRLRPYVREFLNLISPYYFMQVYTLAERPYALQVIQKIDPDGKYFNQRILTREDSTQPKNQLMKKSMSDFFLSGQHMAVVIDDTRAVWSYPDGSYYEGLVEIKPFEFFTTISQPTMVKNPQFIPKNLNMEALNDHYLERITAVMTEINSRFYEQKSQNVADIIKEMKENVFKDCYIFFCSIWREGNIAQKRLYIGNAEEFGGHVVNEFVPYVTHIVTTDPRHKDIIEAQKYKGIYILNYKWFLNSIYRYERQPEMDQNYAVVGEKQIVAPLLTDGPEERPEPPQFQDVKGSDLDDILDSLDKTTDGTTQSATDSDDEEESHEYGSSCDSEDISFLYKKPDDSEGNNDE
ncbi:RNA polymerase II [Tritrichomonas musculus]|uniref:RNA polymerase II subunit A C-terminal domain phosphatase n=1 Tax=Tritrichomonas musculus TaxID=1915356 RepID=A0ABR2K7Y8_9EUKA